MLGFEIVLTVVGVLALCRGRLAVTRTRVVVGTPARVLGLVALTPLPLAATAGLLLAMSENPAEPRSLAQVVWILNGIELGICLCVAVVVFGAGAVVAVRPVENARDDAR